MKSSFLVGKEAPPLFRICVDELIQYVARVLVAPLQKGVEAFHIEDLTVWGDEVEFYLEGLDDLSRSRLSGPGFLADDHTNAGHPFWESMRTALEVHWPPKEGLLYLVGNYRVEENGAMRIVVDATVPLSAQRIDRLDPVKGYLKRLYTTALTTGGDGHAASDHR